MRERRRACPPPCHGRGHARKRCAHPVHGRIDGGVRAAERRPRSGEATSGRGDALDASPRLRLRTRTRMRTRPCDERAEERSGRASGPRAAEERSGAERERERDGWSRHRQTPGAERASERERERRGARGAETGTGGAGTGKHSAPTDRIDVRPQEAKAGGGGQNEVLRDERQRTHAVARSAVYTGAVLCVVRSHMLERSWWRDAAVQGCLRGRGRVAGACAWLLAHMDGRRRARCDDG